MAISLTYARNLHPSHPHNRSAFSSRQTILQADLDEAAGPLLADSPLIDMARFSQLSIFAVSEQSEPVNDSELRITPRVFHFPGDLDPDSVGFADGFTPTLEDNAVDGSGILLPKPLRIVSPGAATQRRDHYIFPKLARWIMLRVELTGPDGAAAPANSTASITITGFGLNS